MRRYTNITRSKLLSAATVVAFVGTIATAFVSAASASGRPNVNPSLHASNAFEVPHTAGVKMHDLLTVSLNGAGTIDHVINGIGAPVTPTHQGPTYVVSYP